jgi:hypothetical protein
VIDKIVARTGPASVPAAIPRPRENRSVAGLFGD